MIKMREGFNVETYRYPKINTLWKRTEKGNIIIGEYSEPTFINWKGWIITEKVDGTNIRIIKTKDNEIFIKGKKEKSEIPSFLLEKLQKIVEERRDLIIETFPNADVILFGEGYGHRIQKTKYLQEGTDFVLFDLVIEGYWQDYFKVEKYAGILTLEVVPLIDSFCGESHLSQKYIIEKKFNRSMIADFEWNEQNIEGIVAKPNPMIYNKKFEPIQFKLKKRDYKDVII